MAEIYISTTLRHFQTDLDNFYSRDFELCGTVYRRLDLAYFAYLYRAFNRAHAAYLNCEIEESRWLRCAGRWREVISLAFNALNLHSATEEQLAALLITPDANDPDAQYDRLPAEVNIFTAHSDYGSRSAAREIPVTPREAANAQRVPAQTQKPIAASYQTQSGLLFEEGII